MRDITKLLDHLCKVMDQLETKAISTEDAKAQAALVKQSNNLIRYELDCKKFEYKMKQELIPDGDGSFRTMVREANQRNESLRGR